MDPQLPAVRVNFRDDIVIQADDLIQQLFLQLLLRDIERIEKEYKFPGFRIQTGMECRMTPERALARTAQKFEVIFGLADGIIRPDLFSLHLLLNPQADVRIYGGVCELRDYLIIAVAHLGYGEIRPLSK